MGWSPQALKAPNGAAIESLKNLDPYLIWELACGRAFADKTDVANGAFPANCVLVKFHVREEIGLELGPTKDLHLLPTHFHSVHSSPQRTQWRSCLVDAEGLSVLLTSASKQNAGVERFELSEVRAGPADLARANKIPFRGNSNAIQARAKGDLKAFLVATLKAAVAAKASELTASSKPNGHSTTPLVCVIDDRCNFASASLLASGQSVIESIWFQTTNEWHLSQIDSANGPQRKLWEQPLHVVISVGPYLGISIDIGGALHGRIFETAKLLGPAAARGSSALPMGEPDAYKAVAYLNPTYRWSHGSAILDLIAGRETWGMRRPGQWMEPRKQPRETAPTRVCFVQLPSETVADTSGGSLGSHVLDGIHHALEEANPGQHVIVNVSYGTHSGPHDGTSLFECALNELLEFYDGSARALGKTLHVVLPAGNSHLWRCHAGGWLTGRGSSARRRLLWKVLPDDAYPSFIEIWLPFGEAVSITVTSPNGEAFPFPDTPSVDGCFLAFRAGGASNQELPSAALIWPTSVPQGQHRTMALLAVQASMPPTSEPAPFIAAGAALPVAAASTSSPERPPGPHGVWTIDLEKLPEADPVYFDAWVQRADAAPGRGPQMRGHRGRQSYLLETQDCCAVVNGQGDIEPRCTMNGIATLKHDRLYVIGAMRRSDGSISHYSAGGPNAGCDKRFDGPDWVVPADESFNNPGLLTTGVLSGSRQRVPGTSMAAAAFTRLLYEHLVKNPDAKNLCGPTPEHSTRLPKVPCGAPQHADPMHRGECVRLMPTNVDGTLDFPCAAGSSPPNCKRPA